MAFWVPMASMVMMAPSMATKRNNSGMAVISLDLSAQVTWPNDNPARQRVATIDGRAWFLERLEVRGDIEEVGALRSRHDANSVPGKRDRPDPKYRKARQRV